MKRYIVAACIFLLVLLCGQDMYAKETLTMETQELMEEMDFSDISNFLKREKTVEKISFEDIVHMLMGEGESFSYETVGEYLKEILIGGIAENKALFLELLVVTLAFSIVKNFAGSFSNSYISEICFLVCYCFMMILLLQSFSILNETVLQTTESLVGFMKVFIPTYCMAISFSLNLNSSAAAYSMTFGVIYIVEWLIHNFLIPLVQIYVIIEFMNHLMDGQRFKKLAELICDLVKNLLKITVSVIFGINIIQGLIAPAMDRLTGNTVAKTLQMIPGIGNVMSGMGQIFLSSGLVIKNCVGAAALIILVLLCAVPYVKVAFLAGMYKMLAAVLEPVADKRLLGGMNGVSVGGMLYLKILGTCIMLFFLTIALTSAATNFTAGG
ncbi:MAG: stage III sporulation protein AE [Lachnospiraceae bacterium]|nr:stage III sporulation protein AE [Lachnospiraceae bacterium]